VHRVFIKGPGGWACDRGFILYSLVGFHCF
jgi:hypothetical protein